MIRGDGSRDGCTGGDCGREDRGSPIEVIEVKSEDETETETQADCYASPTSTDDRADEATADEPMEPPPMWFTVVPRSSPSTPPGSPQQVRAAQVGTLRDAKATPIPPLHIGRFFPVPRHICPPSQLCSCRVVAGGGYCARRPTEPILLMRGGCRWAVCLLGGGVDRVGPPSPLCSCRVVSGGSCPHWSTESTLLL